MVKQHPLIVFFVLTFTLTWGIALIYFLFPRQLVSLTGEVTNNHPLVWLATLSPSLNAFGVLFWTEGWSGVRGLLRRLTLWRVGPQWYAFIFLVIPTLGVMAALLNGQPSVSERVTVFSLPLLIGIRFLRDPGTFEEIGWSGYARPRFFNRFDPLTTSIVFGLIWAVWHLPAFFVSGMNQSVLSFPVFVVGSVVESILITWILRNTQGSVLMAMLTHFMVNFTQFITGNPLLPFTGLALLLSLGIVAIHGKQLSRDAQPLTGSQM